jgi:hypothetical protein
MLRDPAIHLDAPSGTRHEELVIAPHQMLFENACATGSIAVSYRGNLDAVFDELAPRVAGAGWTVDPAKVPIPVGNRAANYWKRSGGVYYRLTLAESPATQYTPASTAIVILVPDAHDVNRFRTIVTG